MKVLILGANGLLGQSLLRTSSNEYELFTCARGPLKVQSQAISFKYHSLDVTDFTKLKGVIDEINPDWIINAAAYTHVDHCEDDLTSKTVNVDLVEFLAKFSCKICHVSSDYVFDGKSGPYREGASTNPLSEYGHQKLISERHLTSHPHSLVLRTSWVYGPGEGLKLNYHDFVKLSLEQGKPIKIVDDQLGNPTFSNHLAQAIWTLIKTSATGIFHSSGSETVSRLDWAYEIADYYQLDKSLITPIKTQELNQQAQRPLKSGFILDKITQYFPQIMSHNLNYQINEYESYQYDKRR